jgi:hypothetical protein
MPAQCRKVNRRGYPPARLEKPRIEAPVNGGRNYNGPKVSHASLSKTELYAGNSSHSRSVLARLGLVLNLILMTDSKNPTDKGTIRREGSDLFGEPSETLRSVPAS